MKRTLLNRKRAVQLSVQVELNGNRTIPTIAKAMKISGAHAHRLLVKHGYKKVWVSPNEKSLFP